MSPHAPSARLLALCSCLCLLACVGAPAAAAPQAARATLFRDVRIFDGRASALSAPAQVLVRGRKIERISSAPIAVGSDTTVVEGGGRVLMPGLIDTHWHAMYARPTAAAVMSADIGYTNLVAGAEAEATLLRGFTTVRDVGGPSFGLKRAIDEGVLPGPRIFPSGAAISQTGGHGDFRMPYEVPRAEGAAPNRAEVLNASVIADSPDQVRQRAREQLMLGATQLKLMAGGGVSSAYDPLDVTQYTEAELHAAVEAAENWGTYVTVHAYTPRAIQIAIAAGVKCIEHGQLMDEPTAQLMAAKGVWLCLQPFLGDEDAIQQPTEELRAKAAQVNAGTENAYTLAKKYELKTAFGTDTLFDAQLAARQGQQLAKLARWYTPAEVLRMATADNGELLALCGARNPYPGPLGVVAEGAWADLLLVDGDPLSDLALIADPDRNFVVIMKDGVLYKNRLAR